jgi:hypothetical protein
LGRDGPLDRDQPSRAKLSAIVDLLAAMCPEMVVGPRALGFPVNVEDIF